jgi:PIN domain nuclease of toxin-antitoxin system
MKLLLDTHILIWLVEGSDSLSQTAKEAIDYLLIIPLPITLGCL